MRKKKDFIWLISHQGNTFHRICCMDEATELAKTVTNEIFVPFFILSYNICSQIVSDVYSHGMKKNVFSPISVFLPLVLIMKEGFISAYSKAKWPTKAITVCLSTPASCFSKLAVHETTERYVFVSYVPTAVYFTVSPAGSSTHSPGNIWKCIVEITSDL